MRTEPLYSTDQGYITRTTESVELYEGAFLQMIGRGEGTIDWSGESGRLEWTNFPPRGPDGAYLATSRG